MRSVVIMSECRRLVVEECSFAASLGFVARNKPSRKIFRLIRPCSRRRRLSIAN